jgi:hypothetical protein
MDLSFARPKTSAFLFLSKLMRTNSFVIRQFYQYGLKGKHPMPLLGVMFWGACQVKKPPLCYPFCGGR